MKKYIFLILISAFALKSFAQNCQKNKTIGANFRSHETDVSSLATNLRSDTVNILKYTINLTITDFTNKIIAGNTVVKFTPKMNGVNKLNLDLLELLVDSVEITNTNLSFAYNDTLLSVNLGATYNINDMVNVKVYYHGTP